MPATVPAGSPVAGAKHELVLHIGDRTAQAVITEMAAAVRQLRIDGVDLIPGSEDCTTAPFSCGAVLVPWPNRVRDGRWHRDGRTHQLEINDVVHGSALHGLLSDVVHQVLARTASSITLGAQVNPSPGYPFRLSAQVCYRLVADGLVATHTVRNIGSERAPVAIGAHPFLMIGDVPTETLTLTVNASHHIDVDDRLTPTGLTAVGGTGWDLRGGRRIAELDLDDAFSGLAPGAAHTLRAPDGRTVFLWTDESFGFVHVFITRAFPHGEQFVTAVALEPMTAPANALNSGVGLRWLAPGESMSASWGVDYTEAGALRRGPGAGRVGPDSV